MILQSILRLQQLLVTHHVELVLPGARYLVRMLGGRIDTQGTVEDLRAQGVLDDIAHHETMEAHRQEQLAVADKDNKEVEVGEKPAGERKPRKLVEEERREKGGVKWKVYKTYLKAS